VALQLVYETPAITTDNEAGIATGWLPGRLSERGREAAADLGRRRRDDGIGAVFVSDLERALETVRIAFGDSGLEVITDERLRECNYGRLNGMPRARLDAERAAHVEIPWPDGESYRDVIGRTASFLEGIVRSRDGGRVLVVAHSANKLALDHLLLGASMHEAVKEAMAWQPGWEYLVPRGWRGPASAG
jgi:broad specificity phosphatase PhoE